MTNPSRRGFIQSSAAITGGILLSGKSFGQAEKKAPVRGIEGYIAPEIELDYWIDKDGEPATFSVTESRGKWVFLKCFQNWCPGCHSSGFPTLKAFADRFHDHPEVAIAGTSAALRATDHHGPRSRGCSEARIACDHEELPNGRDTLAHIDCPRRSGGV